MRKVLITGGGGFLGSRLVEHAPLEYEVHSTRRSGLFADAHTHGVELSERGAVDTLWDRIRPDLVIHTAYSMQAGERDIVQATRNVAAACARTGAGLIHLSTDLVLDGEHAPYDDTAEPAPVHRYGEWKAEAERIVRSELPESAILRPSLITSFDPPDPRTRWVIAGLVGEAPLTLYTDEIRCPIARDDLVAWIWEIAALPPSGRAGVWNLVGPEAMSRYALGALIAACTGLTTARMIPAASAGAPERRPRDLRLRTDRADAALSTRARPISEIAAACLAAASPAR